MFDILLKQSGQLPCFIASLVQWLSGSELQSRIRA